MKARVSLLVLCMSIATTLATTPSHAATPLIKNDKGAVITDEDVLAEIQHAPSEMQQKLKSDPEKLKQIATNLYLARALALQAEAVGFDKTPSVALQLHQIRERELANAWLDKSEGALPDDASLEKAAMGEYKAYPERYKEPIQVHARHILIKKERENARDIAEGLLNQLKNGADFATLASEQSDDPGSKTRGGDLGFFAQNRMVKPFADAAFALSNPGDLSDIVETQFGFHIIKLEERKGGTPLPFDTVKESIKRNILTEIRKTRRNALLDPVRAEAKYDDSAFAALAAEEKK